MKASGYGTDVELEGTTLRVTATGKIGRGALGTDERIVDLNSVTALTFSEAGMMKNGSLTLVDERGKTHVHFRKKSNDEMRAMYEAVSERVPPEAVGATTKGASLISEDRDAFKAKGDAWIESHMPSNEGEEVVDDDAEPQDVGQPDVGQPEVQQTTASPPGSMTAELEQLTALHAQGALDDDEFKQAKRRLLDSPS